MTTSVQPDSLFQIFIKDFAAQFGIQDPTQLETQKREIVPESVQIDTVVSFPDDFDFTKLHDRIFPFWGKENVVEYKGEQDRLTPLHVYQYSWTELGILTTHLLSKAREDRKERQPISQRAAREQWQRLAKQGAQHSCCCTIISTTDPIGLRALCGFEAVETYDHLQGALYRRVVGEDKAIGSVATYLVVLNKLPIHPKNAPLLLLSTGSKLDEFCQWLLKNHEEVTIQEQQYYMLYLAGYNLVKNREVLYKMRKKLGAKSDTDYYMIELMAEDHVDDRAEFFQGALKRGWKTDSLIEATQAMLQADSPLSAAQTILQVDSPLDMAQKALQADSPSGAAQTLLQADSPSGAAQALLQADSPSGAAQTLLQADSPSGAAQALLQADSPEEAAFKLIQNEEQMERLLALIQQQNLEQTKHVEEEHKAQEPLEN